MAKTTYTATTPSGKTFTRNTWRVFTHCVVVEFVRSNGERAFTNPIWTVRPGHAQKQAAKLQFFTHYAGKQGRTWVDFPNGGEYRDADWTYTEVILHALEAVAK